MKKIDGQGSVNYGHNVNISYFAQNKAEELNPELSVYETVDSIAEGEIRKELRNVLGAFLFEGEDVFKKVKVLSGGERTRLALCQLLLSPSNFLILDEPTNHLDIASKEILKKALKSYKGTFVVVSHDREFLYNLTNRIWEIDNKTLKIHHFSVQEFLEMKNENPEKEKKKKPIAVPSKKNKKHSSYKEKSNIEKEIKKVELKINQLEQKQKEIQLEINNLDYTDEKNAAETLNKYNELKDQIDEHIKKWEMLLEKE